MLTEIFRYSNKLRGGGVDTNWDGHHDGGVVGRGVQFPLSENALSGWMLLNNLHLKWSKDALNGQYFLNFTRFMLFYFGRPSKTSSNLDGIGNSVTKLDRV